MKFLFVLAGIATVGLVGALVVWSLKQAKSGNLLPLLVLMGCAVLLSIVLFVFSSPKISRFVFGKRWATEVVGKGDRLDLGDGKFRLLVGKDLALKLLRPGDAVCVRTDKPHVWVLQDERGREVLRDFPAGAETWYAGLRVGYIILRGKVPETTIQLTDEKCPARR